MGKARGRRRPAIFVLSALLVVVVTTGGATGLSIILTRSPSTGTARSGANGGVGACVAPTTASPTAVTARIGAWRFRLTEPGAFEDVSSLPGNALAAIEACGKDESSLRVVRLDMSAHTARASSSFPHAAMLASSLAVTPQAIWFGEGRLALTDSVAQPPYLLSLVRLDPRTLAITSRVELGRGYGLALSSLPGGDVLASTGRQLVRVLPSGVTRAIASFPGAIAQHVAVAAGGSTAVVSLFTPAAVPPVPSTGLAVIDLGSGRAAGSAALAAGSEIQSVAVSDGTAFVAVGQGLATSLVRYGLSPVHALPPADGGVATRLQTVVLDSAGGTVFVSAITLLACVSGRSGNERARTVPKGAPPPFVSQVVLPTAPSDSSGGGRAIAVTPAGIGVLSVPHGCLADTGAMPA